MQKSSTLQISKIVAIPLSQIEFEAVRAHGAGGQNVNKVASAVHLRFDIQKSSLSEEIKARLLALKDNRISNEGVIVIKARQHRTQRQNKVNALNRLRKMILAVLEIKKERKPTRPTKGSKFKRLELKSQRGQLKGNRARVDY